MATQRARNRKDVAKHRNTKRMLMGNLKKSLGLPEGVTEIVALREAIKFINKVGIIIFRFIVYSFVSYDT